MNNPPTQGIESVQWLAKKTGLHTGTCSVDPEKLVNYWGIKKTIYFDIAVVEPASQASTGRPSRRSCQALAGRHRRVTRQAAESRGRRRQGGNHENCQGPAPALIVA